MSSLVQQVLSGLVALPSPVDSPPIASNATAPSATNIPSMPSDVSSLIAMLFSFSALRDWFKLIVIGGFIETCRRFIFYVWRIALNAFWITAHFDESDSTYGV
jgi:chaperone BCS1